MNHFLILFSVIIYFFGNSGEKNKLNGDWLMVCYEDAVKNIEKCNSKENKLGIVKITFGYDGLPEKFKARTPANTIKGDYTINDNKLIIKEIIGTEVKENSEFGEYFYNEIGKVDSFLIRNDSLVFIYESNLRTMKFVRLHQAK